MAELLDGITSSELTEWAAYAEMEPFGALVDDLRAGLAPAAAINANRAPDARVMGPLDFYPWRSPELFAKATPPKPPTPEELAREIKLRIFGVNPDEVT